MFQLEYIGRVSTWDPMPIATQTLSEDGLVGNDGYHRFSWHTYIANRLASTHFYTNPLSISNLFRLAESVRGVVWGHVVIYA